MISATITGRLAADPETKTTNGGHTVTEWRMASNSTRNREETSWIRCSAWGKQGEIVAQYKRKGDFLIVVGELSAREWEDNQGNKRTSLELDVRGFDFGPRTEPKPQQSPRGGYGGGKAAPADDIPF